MNKTDLINNISSKSGLTKKDVESVLNGFLGEITEALAGGDKVQLIGFGTFETRKRSGRTGRNPQTGKTIVITSYSIHYTKLYDDHAGFFIIGVIHPCIGGDECSGGFCGH